MNSNFGDFVALTSIPIGALVGGAIVAIRRTPGPRLASAVQHFTAGVVFAAVAVELLPAIVDAPALPIAAGFVAGVVVMLGVGRLTNEEQSTAEAATGKGVGALFAAMSVDVFIDGLLVGIAFSAGRTQGALLACALALELLFLGLSATTSFTRAGFSSAKSFAAVVVLALLVASGAALGDTLLAALAGDAKTALLAFGVSALLYLVTEELLVEAHEVPETGYATSMFFVGFLAILLLEKAMT